MKNILHKIMLILTFALQVFFGCLGVQGVVNAQTTPQQMGFQCNGQVVPIGTACSTSVPIKQLVDIQTDPLVKRLTLSMGDARYVKNQSGAIVLNVPAGSAADLIYTKLGSTPQVWAAYNPGAAVGRIQVIRAVKRPADKGMVTLYFNDFSPKVGLSAVKDGYHYVDPYRDFVGVDDLWHNISYQGFLTAVGKAMLKNRTSVGYVSIPNIRQEQQTSSSGGLFTTTSTTTVSTYVKPMWIFATSVENGGAQAFQAQYLINPARCNPSIDPRACIVKGGVNFVVMTGGNMHEEESPADFQVMSQTSFTFIAMIVFVAAAAFTAGAALVAAAPAVGNAMVAVGGAAGVAGIAAAAYAGINMAISGTACGGCAQGTLFGTITSGVAAPSAGGFGDPSAAITTSFVNPGVGGSLQAGQAAHLLQHKPKTWSDSHDPAYLQANPPLRSGVMSTTGYGANPVR